MKTGTQKRNIIGIIALAMICVLIGTYIGGTPKAVAQGGATKLEGVVTSPFTEAVEAVHASVVGVSNYKTYRVNNYDNYNNFGFGFGFGYGNGNGRGNNGNSNGETREVKAGTGSGTVISDQGHVLTNYHVVDGASTLKVTVEQKEYDAQLIAYDVDLDIAILQAKEINLPAVSLGDSESLRVGDWAICIGNPLDETFVGTTTAGIVSGLNREIATGTSTDKYGRKTETVNTMIQVDASINSGNSGGGMFNVLGELVGIPTIKYSSSGFFSSASIEGIGMCIPINAAKPLIDKVLSGEITSANSGSASSIPASERPRIGVSISTINGANFDTLVPSGAYIHLVEENAPAQEAGLIAGDIVVEANNELVTSSDQLITLFSTLKAGDTVSLVVYRAEGLGDVLARYFDGEQVAYDELPTKGEYVNIDVVLKMIEEPAATETPIAQ